MTVTMEINIIESLNELRIYKKDGTYWPFKLATFDMIKLKDFIYADITFEDGSPIVLYEDLDK